MQYVNFGTTGLQISRLGFGGIPIQRIDQPGTRELLIAAHKAGINYIDTARAYTVSEAWIGQSLEEAGLRDDFILATKCRALTKADMEAEIATSLKNLRTDHIELFQFHNPSLDGLKTILAPGGAMEALLEAKTRGTGRQGRMLLFRSIACCSGWKRMLSLLPKALSWEESISRLLGSSVVIFPDGIIRWLLFTCRIVFSGLKVRIIWSC